MQTRLKFLGFFLLVFLPWSVLAQYEDPVNDVEIAVEAKSYTPNFYLGRAEPTTGNNLRLIALPQGVNPDLFTYRWNVNNDVLLQTSQVVNTPTPIANNVVVSLTVIDSDGNLWAKKDEIVAISKPEIIFYEENILRGNKALAIGKDYTMVGEESVIYAEPFFFGPSTASGLRATWKINNQSIEYADNWQRLNLKRPEDTTKNYRLNLEVVNRNNLSETAEKTFNLKFGL